MCVAMSQGQDKLWSTVLMVIGVRLHFLRPEPSMAT
jgi:hypothetical protein